MNKKELENKSIHELRIIGRQIGVQSPTSLNKKTLIEKIIAINQGVILPYKTSKGRPAYNTSISIKKEQTISINNLINEIENILSSATENIITLLKNFLQE